MTPPRPLELKLLQLRERFTAALPRRIDELAHALAECEANPDTLHDLERKFHSLAGTAGTYGLNAIAELAAEGEEACSTDTPVCAFALFDRLHGLINSMRASIGAPPPARIFCVDDDPMHTAYLASILRSAGYDIFTAEDAAEFRMLLTSIEAVNVGGDDFLTKPVAPELLLSVIASRLERCQSMRALIDRDGLTGILNRTAFMRRAETTVAESKRRTESTALAMVDLDHFKAINDRHGHPAGDQVLATFGRFLTTSVRPGDDAGRYGGEEFALLLRNIDIDDAHNLVARLLEDFTRAPFRGSGGERFHVTFSAGVAMLDGSSDLREWVRRADEALYVAKQNGRARIEAA